VAGRRLNGGAAQDLASFEAFAEGRWVGARHVGSYFAEPRIPEGPRKRKTSSTERAAGQGLAPEFDAARGFAKTRDGAQQRGLACAIGAEHRHQLALPKVEVSGAQGRICARTTKGAAAKIPAETQPLMNRFTLSELIILR